MIKLKDLLFEIKYTKNNVDEFKKTYSKDPTPELFDRFNKVLPSLDNKDIFKYKDYDDLIKTIYDPTNNEKRIQEKTEGYEKVFENDKHKVYRIKTREGAIFLGKGTKWCISSTDTIRHWKRYSRNSTLYVILPDKLCVQVQNNIKSLVVWDQEDEDYTSNIIPSDIPNNIFTYIEIPLTMDSIVSDVGTYTLTPNGYDVEGSIDLSNLNLTKIPFKFHKISRNFDCDNNKLTTLENSPIYVQGNFNCSLNLLTSLKYSPKIIGDSFFCSHNNLTTMEYCPTHIEKNLYCSHNKLTTLKGCPEKISRTVGCAFNKLKSLEGSPKFVGWTLDCRENFLVTLDGCPEIIGNDFECSDNPSLKTINEFPEEVRGDFIAQNTDLKDESINNIVLTNINGKLRL